MGGAAGLHEQVRYILLLDFYDLLFLKCWWIREVIFSVSSTLKFLNASYKALMEKRLLFPLNCFNDCGGKLQTVNVSVSSSCLIYTCSRSRLLFLLPLTHKCCSQTQILILHKKLCPLGSASLRSNVFVTCFVLNSGANHHSTAFWDRSILFHEKRYGA